MPGSFLSPLNIVKLSLGYLEISGMKLGCDFRDVFFSKEGTSNASLTGRLGRKITHPFLN
jgi:hypothetical protein